jgi:hypothetical protein
MLIKNKGSQTMMVWSTILSTATLCHFRIHNTKTITRADALESGLDESLMSLLWEKTGVKFYSSHKGIAEYVLRSSTIFIIYCICILCLFGQCKMAM